MSPGRGLGIAVVTLGVIANPWALERWVVNDGDLDSAYTVAAIVALQTMLCAAGLILIRRNPPIEPAALLLAAVSLIIALIPAELWLRTDRRYEPVPAWYPEERSPRANPRYRADSLVGWTLVPGQAFRWRINNESTTVRANTGGFRADADFVRECGRPRIVLLGDSFLFGTGVEYPQTAGEKLADSLQRRVDVYNLALPGHGVDQMLLMLRTRALAMCPSLLVVGFIDEDWDRSLTSYREYEGLAKPMFLPSGDSLRMATRDDRPGLLERAFRHTALKRVLDIQWRSRARHRASSNRWWHTNVLLFDAMARDAGRAGVPIVFVRIPRKGGWQPFATLRRHMDARGFNYIDLADPSGYRAAVHLARDSHLSEAGHAWVAGALMRWLRGKPELALN